MEHSWRTSISGDLEKVGSNISSVLRSERPELQEMCNYLIETQGKGIRPAICILSHYACGGSSAEIDKLASAFEMVHLATLVHDDINDKSEIRRGRRTVHREYTVSKAIILGDFIFAMGFKLIGSADRKVVDIMASASSAMAESEFIQKEFEHNTVVTENDYIRIIRGKTAMPIKAAAAAGAYHAGADDETANAIADFALNVGLAFQIVDDVLDINGDHGSTGKNVGTDMMEGKPTLPVIYAMSSDPDGKKIREIFKNKNTSDAEMNEALRLIKRTDATDRCISKAKELAEAAIAKLPSLKDSKYRDALIDLARYVAERDR
jgi:octaprenyl-diphosphate synthase